MLIRRLRAATRTARRGWCQFAASKMGRVYAAALLGKRLRSLLGSGDRFTLEELSLGLSFFPQLPTDILADAEDPS